MGRVHKKGIEHGNWKGGKPKCVECNKQLTSMYAKRCVFCAARLRSIDPEYIKKLSEAKKGKLPKNFFDMRQKGHEKRKGSKHSIKTRKRMSILKKGSLSYLWKGGVTKKNDEIRRNVDYRIWRERVFNRDDYTCQECGKRGIYIQAHHIKPFAYFPELRFELSNGQTLCLSCHKNTDTYMGRAVKMNKKISWVA